MTRERTEPERIFATVNGSRTIFPSGTTYRIGGWAEFKDTARATEYVRIDLCDDMLAAAKSVLAWAAPIAGDNQDEVAGAEEEQSVEALLAAISRAESTALSGQT